ncbi:hypothetical protein, partial [Microcoleus sp. herbarium14]|uniref:hypothetical protein n=1 Tax=Microcoleus sp. herbarium14 TaxID=3055439 RepID=UPI002FD6408F
EFHPPSNRFCKGGGSLEGVGSSEIQGAIVRCLLRRSGSLVISCPVDYPTSGRGGFTNNICQQSPISKTRPAGILWSIDRT